MNALANIDWTSTLAFLLDCSIKGSIVILIAAIISWVLRRKSAAARHSVWSTALAAQVLIPVFGWSLPAWRVAVVERPAIMAPASVSPVEPKAIDQPTESRAKTPPLPGGQSHLKRQSRRSPRSLGCTPRDVNSRRAGR